MANSRNQRLLSTYTVDYDTFDDYDKMRKEINKDIAVFPVSLEIISVFHNQNPIVLGCRIKQGTLRLGTPLCIRDTCKPPKKKKDGTDEESVVGKEIGKVLSLQKDKIALSIGKEGDEIAVSIQCDGANVSFGRNFVFSHRSRIYSGDIQSKRRYR